MTGPRTTGPPTTGPRTTGWPAPRPMGQARPAGSRDRPRSSRRGRRHCPGAPPRLWPPPRPTRGRVPGADGPWPGNGRCRGSAASTGGNRRLDAGSAYAGAPARARGDGAASRRGRRAVRARASLVGGAREPTCTRSARKGLTPARSVAMRQSRSTSTECATGAALVRPASVRALAPDRSAGPSCPPVGDGRAPEEPLSPGRPPRGRARTGPNPRRVGRCPG